MATGDWSSDVCSSDLQVRRLHPGHPAGPADGAVPRPRADAADAAGLALPGRRGGAAGDLHRALRLLAGDLARTNLEQSF